MVVDDTREFTIALLTLAVSPRAMILDCTYPTPGQTAGASVPVSMNLQNIGNQTGVLWAEVVDRDTGSVVGARKNTSSLTAGAVEKIAIDLGKMPSKNWNLRINAGHG